MRRILVAANWKMNGDQANLSALAQGFKAQIDTAKVDVAVFAPFVYLPMLQQQLAGSAIAWGGQNAYTQEKGAFTGETSLSMLKEFGCTHVLVGHSERRTLFGDTDQVVAAKTQAAIAAGVVPVVCIGETLAEREADVTETVVATQIQAVIDLIGVADLAKTVIAYEPVWAIGTGKTASAEQAQAVHAFIRQMIAKSDAGVAEKLLILYGGSVKAASAAELFGQPDIDGGLVGGAALDLQEFVGICSAV